jgi:hypothetical protein
MVKWENACLPKDFRGAGIINTRILNEALLSKWVWWIYNQGEGDICCQLLENKNTYIASLSLSAATKEGLTFGKGLT